ncbi:hypothetical protein SNEBB_006646 [Seison nebaliae]|nr:hypothetical protein SNEBB_006646 [Seison nebaliae]
MNHFTDDEIKRQLQELGYENLSPNRFKNFREDLAQYIEEKESVSFNDESTNERKLDHSWNESQVSYEFHSPRTLDFQSSFENGKSFEDNTHVEDDNELFDRDSFHSSTYSIRPTQQQSNIRGLSSSVSTRKFNKQPNKNDNNKNVLKSKYSFDDESIFSDSTTIDDQIFQTNNNRKMSKSALNLKRKLISSHKSATSLSTANDVSQFGNNNNNDYTNQQSCIIQRPVSGRRCPGTNTKRQDPVTRYQGYAQCWKQYPLIGTEKHSKLRWDVKNHLNQQRQRHLDYLKRTDKRTYSAKADGLCERLPRKTRQVGMPSIRLNV